MTFAQFGFRPAKPIFKHCKNITEVTDQNFYDLLSLSSSKPLIVVCYADWCVPCKKMVPSVKQLAKQHGTHLTVGIYNIDKNQDVVVDEYNIMNIPATLFFKDGKLVQKHIGVCSKEQLDELISSPAAD